MKICILTHTLPRFKSDTNSASFISELAGSLTISGHDVTVLAPFDPQFRKYKRPFKLITYRYIWPDRLHISGYSRVLGGNKKMKPEMYLFSTIMSIFALINLIKLSKKQEFDVISAHWVIPNGAIAFLASIITGIPYTVTIPGSDVYLATKNILFKTAMRLAVGRASWIISDSQHYLDQLSSLGIKKINAGVIRYGVDTNKLKPTLKDNNILRNLNIPPKNILILGLGRFVEKKGYVYLIKAMEGVVKYYKNITLLLIGDGKLKDDFIKLTIKNKLSKYITYPGSVAYSERQKYYNLADIFVMPSTYDSEGNIDASPVAMMDAMACGVPVIATRYSGSSELVIEGKTGWMVKENSSKEISKALIKFIKFKNKKQLRINARKIAVNNFDLTKVARKYVSIFEKII